MTHQSKSAKARSPWTDDRMEMLRDLYATGVSASRIAVEINTKTGSLFTRNAVIGVVHRSGMERRGKLANAPRKSSPRPRKPRSGIVPPWMDQTRRKAPTFFLEMERPDVQPKHISLMLLDNKSCRWPYGEGPYTFCGCETLDGPYCFAHTMQSIGKGTESERTAIKDAERVA